MTLHGEWTLKANRGISFDPEGRAKVRVGGRTFFATAVMYYFMPQVCKYIVSLFNVLALWYRRM